MMSPKLKNESFTQLDESIRDVESDSNQGQYIL